MQRYQRMFNEVSISGVVDSGYNISGVVNTRKDLRSYLSSYSNTPYIYTTECTRCGAPKEDVSQVICKYCGCNGFIKIKESNQF